MNFIPKIIDPYVGYTDCNACYKNGGMQCLLPSDWSHAVCCNPKAADASKFCSELDDDVMCATSMEI